MYVYLNKKIETDTELQEWNFIVIDSRIILDNYWLKKRQSKRHKFQTEKSYSRLMNRGYGSDRLKANEVPVTDELMAEIKQQFIDKLKFVIED